MNTASFVVLLGVTMRQIAYVISKDGVLATTHELTAVHMHEQLLMNVISPQLLCTELLMKFLDTPAQNSSGWCISLWSATVKHTHLPTRCCCLQRSHRW